MPDDRLLSINQVTTRERWTLEQAGNENIRSVNAIVGECNDGGLNDIRAMPVARAASARQVFCSPLRTPSRP